MFKWLKPQKTQKNRQNNKEENKPQSYAEFKKLISKIQTLTGVTQGDFQSLYIDTIEQFISYLSEPNQPADYSVITILLQDVITALKKRQGYLLPLGADSETSFREREEWTFAIFTAALFKDTDVTIRQAIVKSILPLKSFAWLHRNTKLFQSWQAYLGGETKQNIFAEIIGTPQQNDNNKIVLQSQFIIKENDQENPIQIEPITKQVSKEEASETEIQEIDLAELSAQETELVQEQKNNQEDDTQNNSSDNDADVSIPTFEAEDFWRWLKETIMHNEMTVNQIESVVHGVEAGILICIPRALDEFFIVQSKQFGFAIKQLSLNQRIALTKAVKKHAALRRNQQGSRIHTYCIGKWEDRQVISGIVISAEALHINETTIPINTALTLDPIDNL